VIPHSQNSWQQVIMSAPEVMDASILSGNVTIETSFYDKDIVLARSMWRIFYD
jgi:retinal rod rhodopsin-sensitive cGMP 3',5'-cyclic phosphodiesterase subunit delta